MSGFTRHVRSFLDMMGSVRLGVTLMIVLAAVSVAGTVVLQSSLPGGDPDALRAHYGENTARMLERLTLTDVFHAPWYHALLMLLAANILFATISRFSLRPAKLGLLLAHGGVLVLLAGGALYLHAGDKGRLVLLPGEPAKAYRSLRDVALGARGERELPFAMRLVDFVEETRPDEIEPSRLAARLAFAAGLDGMFGEPSPAVAPNRPLRRDGWQIFLHCVTPEGGVLLTVSRDPGLWFACVGLTMLAAGTFYASFVRPLFERRRVRKWA